MDQPKSFGGDFIRAVRSSVRESGGGRNVDILEIKALGPIGNLRT
jgi:hypothetical protein